MPQPLNLRDMHIAAVMADGTEHLVRRRNPHQVAWEIYASRKNLPANAGTLSLTFQAWHALKNSGVITDSFDIWSELVDEVYPAAPDGTRLVVDGAGRLCTPDGDRLDDTPDPTQQGPESGL